jgi:type I restriction enzyme, S subunit
VRTNALRVTETGGRNATARHIPGECALSVGMPRTPPPKGWTWSPLTALARLESGHTPSRKHPEYWQGPIPWISLVDAKQNHGRRIRDTIEHTNDFGIANSSARVLPENTVCLSRTASVGYVVVMAQPMATSQDFVNWVCSDRLDPDFLKYLFLAEGRGLLRFASGAIHQTIYFPEAKAFHVCHPILPEQQRIVGILDEAFDGITTARANAERNLQNVRALFESHLQSVFTQRGDGWRVKPLAELCDSRRVITYGVIKLGDEVADGVPCLRTSNVRWLRIETDGVKRIAPSLSAEYARTILKGEEVLVNVRGTLGGVSVALPQMAGWNVSREVAVVPVDPSKIHPAFLAYSIGAGVSQRWLGGVKKGATYVGINIEDLRLLPVQAPKMEEQMVVARSLEALQSETQRLESIYQRKLSALDALKKSLLHQAFNGAPQSEGAGSLKDESI